MKGRTSPGVLRSQTPSSLAGQRLLSGPLTSRSISDRLHFSDRCPSSASGILDGARATSPLSARFQQNSSIRESSPDGDVNIVQTGNTPVHFNKRMWPAKDSKGPVICEQGFTKSLNVLGVELLDHLGERLQYSVECLTQEVVMTLERLAETREAAEQKILEGVDKALAKVHEEAERKQNGFQEMSELMQNLKEQHQSSERRLDGRVGKASEDILEDAERRGQHQERARSTEAADFRQALQELQTGSDSLIEVGRRVEVHLAQVTNEQRKIGARADQTAEELGQLREETRNQGLSVGGALHRLEDQVANLSTRQELAAQRQAQLADHLQELRKDEQLQWAGLGASLDSALSGHLEDVDASLIRELSTLDAKQNSLGFDLQAGLRKTRKEIGRVQQVLNVDFSVEDTMDHMPSSRRGGLRGDEVGEKRVREYGTQTQVARRADGAVQTEHSGERRVSLLQIAEEMEKKRQKAAHQAAHAAKAKHAPPPNRDKDKKMSKGPLRIIHDADAMRQKMREHLLKPKADVTELYHRSGIAQAIARSPVFDNLTFIVILVNAVWIAIDTDHNDSVLLVNASPVFLFAEVFFCCYFTIELLIRFLAYNGKRNCMKDSWFVFDTALVCLMLFETGVITLILWLLDTSGAFGLGNLSILRVARLAKMFRLARVARLLRSIPELVVLMTGLGIALRAVVFFSSLLFVIVYVFGVALRQLTKNTSVGHEYFRTVPWSMSTLMLEGILPDHAAFVNHLSEAMPILYWILVSFIILAAVTIMYMLNGLLVEVVRSVSETEKERLTVSDVTYRMRGVLEQFQYSKKSPNPSAVVGKRPSLRAGSKFSAFFTDSAGFHSDDKECTLSKAEFEEFILDDNVARIIQEVGVDVEGLLDISDVIFEDLKRDGSDGLTFADFIELILKMRGTNTATVKDMNAQLRVMKSHFKMMMDTMYHKIDGQLHNLKSEIVMMDEVSRVGSVMGDNDEETSSDDDDDGDDKVVPGHVDVDEPGSPRVVRISSRKGSRASSAEKHPTFADA